MKFSDGLWHLLDGVKPAYALNVVDVKSTEDTLTVTCATKPIRHRGDTLNGILLDVRFRSPAEGIIGVKISHFAGAKAPSPTFELLPDGPSPHVPVTIQKEKNTILFTSGPLTARVNKANSQYSLDFLESPSGFAGERILVSSGYKSQAVIDLPYKWTMGAASTTSVMETDKSANPHPLPPPESLRYMLSELSLSAGELVYGLGEQFRPLIKNGQVVTMWNRDGGTSSDQAYKNVPFYITNRKYGVFVNHPGEVEFEIGNEKASRVGISVRGEELEYFVIYGAEPKEILKRYTVLTGRPGLPPTWTFGLWLSTSFLTDYDQQTVTKFLSGMKERDCHVRVFHFDCFWMKQYEWCNFTFDPENFPDPAQFLSTIKKQFGVNVCLWINPYIGQMSPLFQEGKEGGYFIKRTNGDVWQWDLWQPGLAIVDFTNPEACTWYTSKLRKLLEMGVDAFKTDFGERIPHADVKFYDGSDPYRMHNAYAYMYNKVVFNLLQEVRGKNEAVLFARSATAGGQRFPVHWGGDCESTWEAMAETLRGGLSLCLSGFGFWSHDIGGFEGHPPAEIYMRWVAFGIFSSHTRLHGSASYRVPWNYGEEAARVMAKLLSVKHRLMPYLYAAAIEAHETGTPVMRATFLEYPNDRTTYYLDQQYLLGPSLLVAPVFGPSTHEHEYYLPAGRWVSFWDDKRAIEGPRWVREKVGYEEVPVWVREGRTIVLGPGGVTVPDYEYTEGCVVRAYDGPDGVEEVVIPSGKGAGVACRIVIERGGKSADGEEGKVGVKVLGGTMKGCKGEYIKGGEVIKFDV